MSEISDKDRAAAEAMAAMMEGQGGDAVSDKDKAAAAAMEEMLAGQASENTSDKDRAAADAMAAMLEGQTLGKGDAAPGAAEKAEDSPAPAPVRAQAVSFGEVKDTSANGIKNQNLDFIMDIPLRISVELGRSKVMVGDLLRMSHGSVIELDKMAGEPMEVMVNDKLIAKGEVVLVNEKLGIRLTDIVSQTERIKKLA